jgi:glycosyltransferase involved in cell wall biosynthesis
MDDINIITPINQLGYGIAGLNIVNGLHKAGYRVALSVIGQAEASPDYHSVIKECSENAKMPNFDAPCVRIWHQFDMSQFIGKGDRIGFPIFELDKFTEQEVHHLSSLDKIFVCSEWAKNVIKKNGIKVQTHVVPLGVDINIFQRSVFSRKSTIFFNCGKWEKRKGHDILPEIFAKAFSLEDDVELWMMCENPFCSPEENQVWIDSYKRSGLGDKIRLIPRQQSQKEVYNIMKQTDCGVFPSRAEGWNLELLEMMSCGKHVIATDYSAHTEFCNNTNCHLVSIKELEEARDNKWFFGDGNWASVKENQINQTVSYMQKIHNLKQKQNLEINHAGIKTAEKFSWGNTTKEIICGMSKT